MRTGFRRSVIDLACSALQAVLPASLQSWGLAVRYEASAIPDDSKALMFTFGCLCGLMPRAVASRLLKPFLSLAGENAPYLEGPTMHLFDAIIRKPRALGIICAIGAVVLGILYMVIVGAPVRYLGVNAGALAIGLSMLALVDRTAAAGRRWAGGASVAMAIAMLATALFGSEVDGAARWVNLGGVAIQPSQILMPVMLVTFSRIRSVLATVSIITAAVAMALQPDRAMAGMLALCLAALALMRPDRHVCVALAASIASFAVTLVRPDTLPAVPYVDQVFYSSFDIHIAAGVAVLGGMAIILVPAIVGWSRDADNRAIYCAFGTVWFAAIIAAALGNYPTPIVGYGGSAIIGYVLSLLALPKLSGRHAGAARHTRGTIDGYSSDAQLFVALV